MVGAARMKRFVLYHWGVMAVSTITAFDHTRVANDRRGQRYDCCDRDTSAVWPVPVRLLISSQRVDFGPGAT